jgi:hypothetical protein
VEPEAEARGQWADVARLIDRNRKPIQLLSIEGSASISLLKSECESSDESPNWMRLVVLFL